MNRKTPYMGNTGVKPTERVLTMFQTGGDNKKRGTGYLVLRLWTLDSSLRSE